MSSSQLINIVDVISRSGVDEGVKQFLDSCAKITLYLILAMAVINELGMETTSIVAVLGSAGLALGRGSNQQPPPRAGSPA